jgi:hypothetical protein
LRKYIGIKAMTTTTDFGLLRSLELVYDTAAISARGIRYSDSVPPDFNTENNSLSGKTITEIEIHTVRLDQNDLEAPNGTPFVCQVSLTVGSGEVSTID